MVPQAGSGTRNTFLSILDQLNGAPAFQLRPDAVVVQEHDAAPIAADPNGIAPFSTGRAATAAGIDLVEGAGSWSYVRALYNVVREADLTAPWFNEVFGSDGWICGGTGLPLIQAAGFSQLAHPFDGGVCGEPTQTATNNFTSN
jgi:phosphate transport system substrate-binding protein